MELAQAFQEKLIDRFEMMKLAEQLSELNRQQKHIDSFQDVAFDQGNFVFHKIISVKKKDILLCLSTLLTALLNLSNDKRLTSIFMNHYLSCLNNMQAYKYLPKSKKKPFIIACGGLSGSGKSRIAREIAPVLTQPLGAVIIRDDIVRKQLAGVSFDTQLNDSYYTAEFETRVYREMRRQAKHVLKAGYPVIFDALFLNEDERKKLHIFAQQMQVPLDGLWMKASLQTRLERIQSRQNNPSDVKTQKILEKQMSYNTGIIFWHVIDTDISKDQTLSKVRRFLKKYL